MNEDQNKRSSVPTDFNFNPKLPSTTFAGSISSSAKPKPEPNRFVPPKAHKTKAKKNLKRPLVVAVSAILLVAVGLGSYLYLKPDKKPDPKEVLSASTQQGKVARYLPVNLPAGYSYNNDYRQIQPNVFYYSINGQHGDKFHVTIQPIPPNFDFNTFGRKFLKPDQYAISIGTVVAGTVGSDLIASIRTTGNSWIIINASNTKGLAQLETVTRSLQLAQ